MKESLNLSTSLPRTVQWTLSCGIILFLSVVCFVDSRHGDFVFDDSEAIVNNADVDPNSTSWMQLLSHDFWGRPIEHRTSHKSYRPLTVLSFELDYWLAGGRHPYTFHVTNIVLHCAVSLLYLLVVSLVLRQAGDGWNARPRAIIAAIIFAVHPVHTECVSQYYTHCMLTWLEPRLVHLLMTFPLTV